MKKKIGVLFLCLVLLLTACAKTPVTNMEQEHKTPDTTGKYTKDEVGTDFSDSNLNIYKDMLDLCYQALYERQTDPEQWDPEYYVEKGLLYSILKPYWAQKDIDDILAKEGFAFLDLNQDGVDELVIGWVGNEFWNMDEGYVFGIYTVVDGAVTLAIEGWERCKYVIGDDGYLYNNGSSSSEETNYTKYRFNPEYEDFLEPIEEVYSKPYPDGDGKETWWEHITNPEDIGVIEYTGTHEELRIDHDEALAIGDAWMEAGIKIDYTRFDEYSFSE